MSDLNNFSPSGDAFGPPVAGDVSGASPAGGDGTTGPGVGGGLNPFGPGGDPFAPQPSGTVPVAYPPFPAHLMPVAVFVARLRRAVFDAPIDPSDPASVVLPDEALQDGLRDALSALTLWSPQTLPLPPLALVAGQGTYPLPADFADPVEETWRDLLGPGPFASGELPGSRYALLQRQNLLDAPAPYGTRGNGSFGGFGYGYGGSWAGMRQILPEDGAGNVLAGPHQRPRAELYPADFDHPLPYLLLAPAPQAGRTLTGLTYRAAWLPRRLVLGQDGQWATDETGGLVYELAPLAADFDDDTDVLPFASTSDLVRQALRYATYRVLTEKVLSLADTDGTKYAFFEEKTGLGRKDIQKIADDAKAEFDERNKHRPRGTRG